MKKTLSKKINSMFLIVIFVFISGTSFAQGSFGAFVGYGQTAFPNDFFGEGVDFTQAGFVPVGAQLLFGVGMFQLGAEVTYATPFTFEQNSDGIKIVDWKITQLYVGGVAKLRLGSGSGLHPYARVGGGMYSGKFTSEFTEEAKAIMALNGMTVEDADIKFKSAFGFNLGAGLEIDVAENTGIFAEIVYHSVKRQLDVEGEDAQSMNNIALQVGVNFGF